MGRFICYRIGVCYFEYILIANMAGTASIERQRQQFFQPTQCPQDISNILNVREDFEWPQFPKLWLLRCPKFVSEFFSPSFRWVLPAAWPRVRGSRGCTPLHYAANKGHDSVVARLLEAEAAVDAKSNTGRGLGGGFGEGNLLRHGIPLWGKVDEDVDGSSYLWSRFSVFEYQSWSSSSFVSYTSICFRKEGSFELDPLWNVLMILVWRHVGMRIAIQKSESVSEFPFSCRHDRYCSSSQLKPKFGRFICEFDLWHETCTHENGIVFKFCGVPIVGIVFQNWSLVWIYPVYYGWHGFDRTPKATVFPTTSMTSRHLKPQCSWSSGRVTFWVATISKTSGSEWRCWWFKLFDGYCFHNLLENLPKHFHQHLVLFFVNTTIYYILCSYTSSWSLFESRISVWK